MAKRVKPIETWVKYRGCTKEKTVSFCSRGNLLSGVCSNQGYLFTNQGDDITFWTLPGFPSHLEMRRRPLGLHTIWYFVTSHCSCEPSHFLFWWHWSWCPVNLFIPNLGFLHWCFLLRPPLGLSYSLLHYIIQLYKVLPCTRTHSLAIPLLCCPHPIVFITI